MASRLLALAAVFFSVLALAWPATAAAAPAWSVQSVPSWVTPLEPLSTDTAAPADSANGGRYLLIDRQVRVGSAAVETYAHWSRQITNEAGLTASSQVKIDFDPSHETLLIHSVVVHRGAEKLDRLAPEAVKLVQREPNLDAQIFDGRQSAVLFVHDLRVGDTVEAAFTIRSADPAAQGHFMDAIALGTSEPTARLHARLVMTSGRPVRLRIHTPDGVRSGFSREPVKTREGTEYRWDLRDVPAYNPDPFTPSWWVAYPWVQVSDFESWAEVAAWASRLFSVDTPSSGALNDWVKNARNGSQQDDFILRAIRFVQDEVRYVGIETGISSHRPSPPATVFERRYGDCKDKAVLLVTILRLAGIDAQPALVSTTRGHVLDELTPTGAAFDHAIVQIAAPGRKVYWVDATTTLQGGGLDRLQYSSFERALVVDGHAGTLETLTPAPTDRPSPSIRDTYKVAFPTSNDETALDSERIYEGETADRFRRQLRAQTREETTKFYLGLYQPTFPAIHEARPLEVHDDRARDSLRIVTHFAIPKFWTLDKNQGRHVVEFAPAAIGANLNRPPTEKRSAPLVLPYPLWMAAKIDLELPFDLNVTPEQSVAGDDAFELRYSSTCAQRRLSYSYDLVTKLPAVGVSDVESHLAQVDKARPALGRSLTYRAPLSGGINWAALVALVGTLPFVCFAAYRAHRYEPRFLNQSEASPNDYVPPIGGWLGLLSIGIVINPFLQLLSAFRTSLHALSLTTWRALTTPELETYAPTLAILIIAEVLVCAAFAVYGFTVAALFFARRRSFPFDFTVHSLGFVVFSVADILLAQAGSPSSKEMSLAVMGTIRALVWATIWVTYVRTSERAAATFVLPSPDRERADSWPKSRKELERDAA